MIHMVVVVTKITRNLSRCDSLGVLHGLVRVILARQRGANNRAAVCPYRAARRLQAE
jgi:hypothetical protein